MSPGAWSGPIFRADHFGVQEYFLTSLFPFFDAEPMADPDWTVVLGAGPWASVDNHTGTKPIWHGEEGTWEVVGRYGSILSRLRDAPPRRFIEPLGHFFFDPEKKLFVEIAIERARVGGILSEPLEKMPGTLRFRLGDIEPFPPADLAARVEKARLSGARFLERYFPEVGKVVWLRDHPVGVPALLGWAVLAGGGDLGVGQRYLALALGRKPRTTYDGAFLLLGLDALLERLEAPGGGEEAGRAGTVAALSSRARVAKLLSGAASFLLRNRVRRNGLWGYRPEVGDCGEVGRCTLTYCGRQRGWRRGLEVVDTSNTYWALDALAVARERGVKVPEGIFRQAADSLVSWGEVWVGPLGWKGRRGNPDKLYPNPPPGRKALLDLVDARDELNHTLRWTRRLRVGAEGAIGSGPRPLEEKVEVDEVHPWAYSIEAGTAKGKVPYINMDTIDAYPVITSQLAGVGALAVARGAPGRDPLSDSMVAEGLQLANFFFRTILVSCDIPKGADRAFCERTGLGVAATRGSPSDLGYNFLLAERLLDFLGVEEFGYHRWFPLLALHSLDLQREDGGWYPWREDRLVPAALQVLFLSRSRRSRVGWLLPRYAPPPPAPKSAPGTPGAGRPEDRLLEDARGAWRRAVEVVATLEAREDAPLRALAQKAWSQAPEDSHWEWFPLLLRVARRGPSRSRALVAGWLEELAGGKRGGEARWLEAWRKRAAKEAKGP